MRRVVLGLATIAIVAVACSPKSSTPSSVASGADPCAVANLNLYAPGKLTIATGNPAYSPWYGGKSVPGSDWKSSSYTGDPHTGQGYESAFAYALAHAPAGSPLLTFIALACGLYWGGLREASRSLLPSLIAHLLWDIALLVLWPLAPPH